MCTVMMLRRPGHAWPFLLGGNRDEMADRPWKAPARHWPDREEVVAGLDETAGGSWLGLNDAGVMAVILNRHGTLGPAEDKRSRGELVLEALDHGDAQAAAEALSGLNPEAYRPFNLVIADNRDAYWLRNRDGGKVVEVFPVPEGLSMLAGFDLNDREQSARTATHMDSLEAAPAPQPDQPDGFADWVRILGNRSCGDSGDPHAAMTIARPNGFGTVSVALLALPSVERVAEQRKPVFLFASGPADQASFDIVEDFHP